MHKIKQKILLITLLLQFQSDIFATEHINKKNSWLASTLISAGLGGLANIGAQKLRSKKMKFLPAIATGVVSGSCTSILSDISNTPFKKAQKKHPTIASAITILSPVILSNVITEAFRNHKKASHAQFAVATLTPIIATAIHVAKHFTLKLKQKTSPIPQKKPQTNDLKFEYTIEIEDKNTNLTNKNILDNDNILNQKILNLKNKSIKESPKQSPNKQKNIDFKNLNDFATWKAKIDSNTKDLINKDTFENLIQKTKNLYKKEYPKNINNNIVQKLIVPKDSTIATHADFHGDAKSLCWFIKSLQDKKYMNGWQIIAKDFYIVLLGDYIDRGNQNIETLTSVLKLKIENPQNVILLRGNHEISSVMCHGQKLRTDLEKQFGYKFNYLNNYDYDKVLMVYDLLPEALFLGKKNNNKTDYILFSHGGINPIYNTRKLFKKDNTYDTFNDMVKYTITEKISFNLNNETQTFEKKHKKPNNDYLETYNHFYTHDFNEEANSKIKNTSNRGLSFNEFFTTHCLENKYSQENHHVKTIIRGHQHNGKMYDIMKNNQGIASLWPKKKNSRNILLNSLVHTLNISPNSGDTSHSFDTYALIELTGTSDQWKITPINSPLLKKINKE